MKKILSLVLVGTIFVGTATPVYAQEETKEKKDASPIFEEYYPERLDDYLENKEAHQNFHEARKSLREETKAFFESIRDEAKLKIEEVKELVRSGEISKDEAMTLIDAIRNENEDLKEYYGLMRDEMTSVIDEKKVLNEELKEEGKVYKDELKNELNNETPDSGVIQSYLDKLLDLKSEHLNNDFTYADMIDSILIKYGISQ